MPDARLQKRLFWSGCLVAAGLIVELSVSSWLHPLAFVTFLTVACPLIVGGMVLFLWALVAS